MTSSPDQADSWFACPHCGEPVAKGSPACRECGSDAQTGWSPNWDEGATPEGGFGESAVGGSWAGVEIPDYLDERMLRRKRSARPWILLGALAALAGMLVVTVGWEAGLASLVVVLAIGLATNLPSIGGE